jgi:hypothetical protein
MINEDYVSLEILFIVRSQLYASILCRYKNTIILIFFFCKLGTHFANSQVVVSSQGRMVRSYFLAPNMVV